MKDVRATGEDSSSQKTKNNNCKKHEIYFKLIFLYPGDPDPLPKSFIYQPINKSISQSWIFFVQLISRSVNNSTAKNFGMVDQFVKQSIMYQIVS